MTAFAGIVSLTREKGIPASALDQMSACLTRIPEDRIQVRSVPGFALARLDLGLLDGSGEYVDERGCISVIAGEPLLQHGAQKTRQEDLQALHNSWSARDHAALRDTTGSFCGVHYDPSTQRVTLVSDKMGLRPLYFSVQGGYLYFSTALRVLQAIDTVRKSVDLQGLAEAAVFGFPLSTRTPYEEVSTIGAGELVEFGVGRDARDHYWRWDALREQRLDLDELAAAVFRAFRNAIARRLRNDHSVAAFLSGGLDSRCIVAMLRSLGRDVHTLNFAPRGGLDLVLGKHAAAALGTTHFEYPDGPTGFWPRLCDAHARWLKAGLGDHVRRPRVLWAGDGGSVCVGHVYLNEQIVSLMRDGRIGDAVDAYFEYNTIHELPPRLLTPEHRPRAGGCLRSAVMAELAGLRSFDEGRRFHLFLVLNDQRRHLAGHFENIDVHRVELVTPFFDSEMLSVILSQPVDVFLRHRFYQRWLEEFPSEATSVPWQTYPGHAPCPLPAPQGLRAQWESWANTREHRQKRQEILAAGARTLRDPRFPARLLNRRVLQVARWATKIGVKDYSYLLRIADTFLGYSRYDDSQFGNGVRTGA